MLKLKVFYSNFRIIDPYRFGKFVYSVKTIDKERFIIPYTPYSNTTIISDTPLKINTRYSDLTKVYDIAYTTIR